MPALLARLVVGARVRALSMRDEVVTDDERPRLTAAVEALRNDMTQVDEVAALGCGAEDKMMLMRP